MSTAQHSVDPFLTVIVPVYNEEGAIADTLEELQQTLSMSSFTYEIIVVDDCSTDKTNEILCTMTLPSMRVIHHPNNRGYGAALKTGIRASVSPVVAITDADGTYPNERIPELAGTLGDKDMVVGSRTGQNVRIPIIRRPAKWFITRLARYLSRCHIPDLNSGLRVFRRETLLKYVNILPDGFSFTTTITLAMLTRGHEVVYTSINYDARIGKSKIRPIRDTLNFIQLILRTVLLFEPLRVFLPAALFLGGASIAVAVYSIVWTPQFMDVTTSVLAMGSIQILSVGMLADMINRRLDR